MKQPEKTEESAEPKTGADYSSIAKQVIQDGTKPSEDDMDSIVAAVVSQLKADPANGWKEGDSEEGLYSRAREMYWRWKDLKREQKKGRSGTEEFESDDDPVDVLMD